MSELARVCAPGGTVIVVTWCHRVLGPGEAGLREDEKALLDRINEAYYLPDWCSVADYQKLFGEAESQRGKAGQRQGGSCGTGRGVTGGCQSWLWYLGEGSVGTAQCCARGTGAGPGGVWGPRGGGVGKVGGRWRALVCGAQLCGRSVKWLLV